MYWATCPEKIHPFKCDLHTLHLKNSDSNTEMFCKTLHHPFSAKPFQILAIVNIANFNSWKDIKNICIDLQDFYKNNILFIFSIVPELLIDTELQKITQDIYTILGNRVIKILQLLNKGMDIGGFFKCFQEIIKLQITAQYFIKLHSKSDISWRQELLSPFSKKNIKQTHLKMSGNYNFGMIGCKKWNYHLGYWGDMLNKNYILKISTKLGISIQEIYDTMSPNSINWNKYAKIYLPHKSKRSNFELYEHYVKSGKYRKHQIELLNNRLPDMAKNLFLPKFIAGTIFMADFPIFFKFFQSINLDQVYQSLEPGYITNQTNTYIHSWERLFGIIVHLNNKSVVNAS